MSATKTDAWMPLYVGDWEASTRHLSCEQDGAYGRLVRHYWKNGPLPDDDQALARITGLSLPRWKVQRAMLASFFKVGDGRWLQGRVETELKAAAARKERAVTRARGAAHTRWGERDATSIQQAMLEQCPSPSPSVARASKKALADRARRSAGERAEGSPPSRRVERVWAGPAEVRALVVERMGEDYAASWLDGCVWEDGPPPRLITPTGLAADRLRRDLRREWLARDVIVEGGQR